jgi:phosphopantothenoylcysteine synthetase/decarboxylase
LRVLLTYGATREPIDGVRFLTNFSTGRTGAVLASELSVAGHEVHCLAGMGSAKPATDIPVTEFSDFADLDAKLRLELSKENWDCVIHLAAVSDYSVAEVRTASGALLERKSEKIDSREDLVLRLKRNFKIVSGLKGYSRSKQLRVIAFKLTKSEDETVRQQAVEKIFGESVDLVVHNDLGEIERGSHFFRVHERGRSVVVVDSVSALARELMRRLA